MGERTQRERQTRRGMLQALTAALAFSISGVCVKAIPWSPLAINGARGAVGALVIWLWMKAAGRRLRWNLSVWIGALALCLTNILYVFAAKLTTAANAILLQYTSPLFVVGLLWLFYHQRPTARSLAACALVLCGTVLFFCDQLTPGSRLGSLLGLASGLTYAGAVSYTHLGTALPPSRAISLPASSLRATRWKVWPSRSASTRPHCARRWTPMPAMRSRASTRNSAGSIPRWAPT